MLTRDLLAFVRGALPEPPARVLEVGAGDGELARALADAGYAVTAIDPGAPPGGIVEPVALIDASGRYDAAVAVVSLHHVEPLAESCTHLATLIAPGGCLVIDELDCERFDERAAGWWLAQRAALGAAHERDARPGTGEHTSPGNGHDAPSDPAQMVTDLRHHVHTLRAVCDALRPGFELGPPVPGPYLHRWQLAETLQAAELDLIAGGGLPPVGARLVARCR